MDVKIFKFNKMISVSEFNKFKNLFSNDTIDVYNLPEYIKLETVNICDKVGEKENLQKVFFGPVIFIGKFPKRQEGLIQKSYKHTCLKCGAGGEDLVIKFYCSNKNCENYHE